MNRNVINYLLHTTIKRAARQSPSYFDLLTSDHLRSTWWLDRLKDVEFDGNHSSVNRKQQWLDRNFNSFGQKLSGMSNSNPLMANRFLARVLCATHVEVLYGSAWVPSKDRAGECPEKREWHWNISCRVLREHRWTTLTNISRSSTCCCGKVIELRLYNDRSIWYFDSISSDCI